MVKIDFKREEFVNLINNAERKLKEAKWDLWCYDNRFKLSDKGLTPGRDFAFGTLDYVLHSEISLDSCVFDDSKLNIVSPIIGGSDIRDSAIYECAKCNLKYIAPLNKKDQKAKDKRMREMRY